MRPYRVRLLLYAVALLGITPIAWAAEDLIVQPQALGLTEPYRILVDKVLMAATGWKVTEGSVREVAGAGFNIYVPREGGDSEYELRRVASLAAKNGLFTMAWLRGSFRAKDDKSNLRYTHKNGLTGNMLSPNTEQFWTMFSEQTLLVARISQQHHNLLGVFLDFENYDIQGKYGWGILYEESYDDTSWKSFFDGKGIPVPSVLLAQRAQWIDEHGMTKQYQECQMALWRKKCRELRIEIDKINPNFRLALYPAPGSPFMVKAVMTELCKDGAPCILADSATYGPLSSPVTETAIEKGRQLLIKRRESLGAMGKTNHYVAGLDPIVKGATPEYCGMGARVFSSAVNGYWVFYEGPVYGQPSHEEYFKQFRKANQLLQKK